MSRLDPAIGRRRERVVGGIVVVVGIAVLVLSIIALAAAGSGASSDVSGPKVTLPGGSGSSTPSATGSPTGSPTSTTSGSPSTSTSSSASTSTSNSPSGATAGAQPLVVLNSTGQSGLAQQAADTFTQGGWTVTSTGNIDQDTISTCAYYDPDVDGAQAAAEALMQQFPKILRTAVKYGALPAGPVVVVIARDYSAQ